MAWLKEGDSNTTFFHKAIKIKSKRKSVHGMKIGKSWYNEPKVLKEKMYTLFRDHFNCPIRKWSMDLLLNFKALKEDEVRNLEVLFTMDEIKDAIWSSDECKALGSDGFNMVFYRKCWDVVKDDLFIMLSKFYQNGKLEKSINSSFITLIPKVENLKDI